MNGSAAAAALYTSTPTVDATGQTGWKPRLTGPGPGVSTAGQAFR